STENHLNEQNKFDDKTNSSDDIENFEKLISSIQDLLLLILILFHYQRQYLHHLLFLYCLSSSASNTITKKAPLKLIIKRIQHPPTSTKIKYDI
ncbi:unnamed protein product, partial [Rotaria sordida]